MLTIAENWAQHLLKKLDHRNVQRMARTGKVLVSKTMSSFAVATHQEPVTKAVNIISRQYSSMKATRIDGDGNVVMNPDSKEALKFLHSSQSHPCSLAG